MIPDFKTYLKESVWGDVRRRAEGQSIRREDDINNLSQDELFNYLKAHYITTKYEIDNDHKPIDKENGVSVPFAIPYEASNHGYGIYMDFKKNGKVITFNSELKKELPDIYNKLCDNYSVSAYTRYLSMVSPLDGGEVTNQFYIDVIEFLIDNVDKKIKIVNRK